MSSNKKILFIGMGGTIASEITEDGLKPELTPDALLQKVPGIAKLCDVHSIELTSLDSTNITPMHWLMAANTIEENYDMYDGFVISHGTDTMAFTAAGLSYLVQNSHKPIIITGAQNPISFENTDSKVNLYDAFVCATSDTLAGVFIVFNGELILGTRARKTRTKNYRAFSSINYPFIATLQNGQVVQYIDTPKTGTPTFYHEMNESVGLLKMIPAMDHDVLEFMLQKKDAVIIESFGVGGMPSYDDNVFHNLLLEYSDKGKIIVMTTQVQEEGSDIGVYSVGKSLKNRKNILEAYDMTTECVLAKLMLILAQKDDFTSIKDAFYTPIAKDIYRKG